MPVSHHLSDRKLLSVKHKTPDGKRHTFDIRYTRKGDDGPIEIYARLGGLVDRAGRTVRIKGTDVEDVRRMACDRLDDVADVAWEDMLLVVVGGVRFDHAYDPLYLVCSDPVVTGGSWLSVKPYEAGLSKTGPVREVWRSRPPRQPGRLYVRHVAAGRPYDDPKDCPDGSAVAHVRDTRENRRKLVRAARMLRAGPWASHAPKARLKAVLAFHRLLTEVV
jgi:hypothetical protein